MDDVMLAASLEVIAVPIHSLRRARQHRPVSSSRRAMLLLGVSLAVVAVVLSACSSGASSGGKTNSNTPRIRSTATDLRRGLVTNDELSKVAGLPRLRAVPLKDAPLFENPDPRGFCGAPIDQPDLSKGATAVFEANSATVSDSIVRLDETAGRAYLDAAIGDTKPGCPRFESMTNTGAQQTVTPGNVVELPHLGDQQTGGTATISLSRQTLHVGEVLLRRGDVLAFAVIFSTRPLQVRTVQQYAAAVNTALNKLT
jgi:hypothetical protein